MEAPPASLIDGKRVAQDIKDDLKKDISNIIASSRFKLSVPPSSNPPQLLHPLRPPSLVMVMVGGRKDSATYVTMKGRACKECGINSETIFLPVDISQNDLQEKLLQLSADSSVDGILLQLPLPSESLDADAALKCISSDKDVDGLLAENFGAMATSTPVKIEGVGAADVGGKGVKMAETHMKTGGNDANFTEKAVEDTHTSTPTTPSTSPHETLSTSRCPDTPDAEPTTKSSSPLSSPQEEANPPPPSLPTVKVEYTPFFSPCTAAGCVELCKRYNVNMVGAHVVVLGRSSIVGVPAALLFIKQHATVTVCHSKTVDIKEQCLKADILIVAIGKALFVKGDWVKKGAVVIDVGINTQEDSTKKAGYRLVGDVDFEACKPHCKLITPVPGGVGPMTVAVLMMNTYKSWCNKLVEV